MRFKRQKKEGRKKERRTLDRQQLPGCIEEHWSTKQAPGHWIHFSWANMAGRLLLALLGAAALAAATRNVAGTPPLGFNTYARKEKREKRKETKDEAS